MEETGVNCCLRYKAFPSGEGGTAIAVTDEGRPSRATAPFGRSSPTPFGGTLPKGEGL